MTGTGEAERVAARIGGGARWPRGSGAAAAPEGSSAAQLDQAHLLCAARRELERNDPRSCAIVAGPDRDGGAVLHLVTLNAEIAVTGRAAALMLALANAHRGADGLPKWSSVGDVLRNIGLTWPGRLDRRIFRTLVRYLRRRADRCALPDLLQTHRVRGVRLSRFPVVMVWSSVNFNTRRARGSRLARKSHGAHRRRDT